MERVRCPSPRKRRHDRRARWLFLGRDDYGLRGCLCERDSFGEVTGVSSTQQRVCYPPLRAARRSAHSMVYTSASAFDIVPEH